MRLQLSNNRYNFLPPAFPPAISCSLPLSRLDYVTPFSQSSVTKRLGLVRVYLLPPFYLRRLLRYVSSGRQHHRSKDTPRVQSKLIEILTGFCHSLLDCLTCTSIPHHSNGLATTIGADRGFSWKSEKSMTSKPTYRQRHRRIP